MRLIPQRVVGPRAADHKAHFHPSGRAAAHGTVSEKWNTLLVGRLRRQKTPMIRRMTARGARLLGARSALLGRAPRADGARELGPKER